jgi:hypothetical protein
MTVFATLAEAKRAGFEVYERTAEGYLVRAKTTKGWVLALVRTVRKP